MKFICSKCNEEKEDTEFHKRKNRSKGRSSACKICSNKKWQEYKKKNPEKIALIFKNWKSVPANMERLKELWAQRDKSREKNFRVMVNAIKDVPCMDCNIKYPSYVMDFDHRLGEVKLFNIGHISRAWTIKRLLQEINKCDIVCSNCHRIRTHNRKSKKGIL